MNKTSPDTIRLLRQHADDGMRVLCRILGKSRCAVFTLASRQGIAIRKVRKYDIYSDELTNKTWAWFHRILPRLNKTPSCWNWKYSNSRGYGQIRIYVRGKSRVFSTHRIALEVLHGTLLPRNLYACHACDNPRCNNPKHIFPGTATDNAVDALRKGRLNGLFSKQTK